MRELSAKGATSKRGELIDSRRAKGGRLYRYYVSQSVLKRGPGACPIGRVPAAKIENAVIDQVRGMLRAPEIIVGTWRLVRQEIEGLTEAQAR